MFLAIDSLFIKIPFIVFECWHIICKYPKFLESSFDNTMCVFSRLHFLDTLTIEN